ncbi:hypothetical protein BN59_03255 [Legionella massiliensis]|uniref:Uncharacterized protein n=1 Tax=Legionella massiliensis TaxID=1034943 RepID=A0A078KX07_9GAMM|nr:hypothetical protein [Legionella massiliensis]CDZ78940.1 hypothetical protein BN59_03255 [Legionella massiliensis]CEE14678.1 hypothetical protein BN1094_03255 [Legionella massiliensis]
MKAKQEIDVRGTSAHKGRTSSANLSNSVSNNNASSLPLLSIFNSDLSAIVQKGHDTLKIFEDISSSVTLTPAKGTKLGMLEYLKSIHPRVYSAKEIKLLLDDVKIGNDPYGSKDEKVIRFLLRKDMELVFGEEGYPSNNGAPAHAQMTKDDPNIPLFNRKCITAGNAFFNERNELVALNNKSGDFQPEFQSLCYMLIALLDNNVPLGDTITIRETCKNTSHVMLKEDFVRYALQLKEQFIQQQKKEEQDKPHEEKPSLLQQNSNESFIELLDSYMKKRDEYAPEYKHYFFCIGLGRSKTEKREAIDCIKSVLSHGINGGAISDAHLKALDNGELGKAITTFLAANTITSSLGRERITTVSDLVKSLNKGDCSLQDSIGERIQLRG